MKVHSARDALNWTHTDKRQEVPVDGAARLYLIVQPSPSTVKSWAWRALPPGGGKMIKMTLGRLSDHSYAQAVAWAAERNRALADGEDVGAARAEAQAAKAAATKAEEDRKARTVKWYYDTLYAPRFLTGKESQRETARQFERHLIPALGGKPINEVTRRDLSAIVNSMVETAPVSANRFVNISKTLFRRAVTDFGDETGMEISPADYLVKPYREEHTNRRQTVLDRRGLGYVVRAIDTMAEGEGFKAVHARALKLVLVTGVRINEAAGAAWSEFDLDAGWWTIPALRSKNRLMHLIPLPPLTLAWLRALRADKKKHKFLFSLTGDKPLSGETSKPQHHVFTASVKLATADGVTVEWSPHALRRTFSTLLSGMTDDDLNPLVPVHVIEALLNHQGGAKSGVAGVYNKHKYHKEKAAALVIWEDYLTRVRREEKEKVEKQAAEAISPVPPA